ncbi:fimbrial protein [Pseudomonas aeruginosa]|uniref:fimbrial protein n=1 Tax=Pseudomonas aeruginosa TaxID=287 RepID=UPI00070CF821|nr:fimbrial protein [Pseudomonas aeruginosa]RUB28255.1 type 1 fimbrial protein [Pseudomonas aeruginosa]HDQ4734749.1 type 1 fimbrial protein [Pseudomonas aeruginosa]
MRARLFAADVPIRAPLVRPVLLCCLIGGLSLPQAWAQDEIARNCTFSNGQGGSWRTVNDLTSSTPRGTVLAVRPVNLFLNYQSSSAVEPHELILGGNWSGVGYPGLYGTVQTNVPGIGYRVSMDAQDGAMRPVPVDSVPHALDRRVTSKAGNTINDYLQELVLTVDPKDLPSGELQVTSVSGSATLNLWAVDMLKGETALGGRFDVPTGNTPAGICRTPHRLVGPAAINIGGGPPPVIPNKCRVDVGQTIQVRLGNVALKDFPRLNDTSTPRAFSITLSDCAAAAKPLVAFKDKYASAIQPDPTILSLKSGGAAGFGIVVDNGLTGQRVRFDGTPYPMRRIGDSADIPLSAAYIRTGAQAELRAGAADGAAEFSFTFP